MASIEWQVADGSSIAHLIDTDKPAPKRSGPRALCGSRPQRHHSWWYALPVKDETALAALAGYQCKPCDGCRAAHGC